MTKSSQELSPNLVTFSSPQFSPFQAVRQKNHHIGWNNKWQNRHPKCHQIWWQFCHLNSHQFRQFTKIFTRMGDNPAENPIENVLGLLPRRVVKGSDFLLPQGWMPKISLENTPAKTAPPHPPAAAAPPIASCCRNQNKINEWWTRDLQFDQLRGTQVFTRPRTGS